MGHQDISQVCVFGKEHLHLVGAEGLQLEFRVVDVPNEWLEAVYQLMSGEFEPDVLDPYDRYIDWINQTVSGDLAFPFVLSVAFVRDGATACIVGVLAGNLMRLEPLPGCDVHEAKDAYFFAIGHQVTCSVLRDANIRGVGRKLWDYSLCEIDALARKDNNKLLYVVTEAAFGSYGYWAKLGFAWPKGLNYWQPPLEFDETGHMIHAEVEETFLVLPVAGQGKDSIDTDMLLSIIACVYRNWSLSKYYSELSPEAMGLAEHYVMIYLFSRVRSSLPQEERVPLVVIKSKPQTS